MTKRNLVSLLLLFTVGLFIVVTRPWVEIHLVPSAAAQTEVMVSGADGNRAFIPVAIALLAIAVVLTIAGRVLRAVLGVLTALFGGWIAWTAYTGVLAGEDAEVAFSRGAIAEATGIISDHPIEIVDLMRVTVWPMAAVALGALVLLAGLAVTVFGWRWAVGGKRYEAKGSPREKRVIEDGSADRIAEWDALSEGEDPSDVGEGEADEDEWLEGHEEHPDVRR